MPEPGIDAVVFDVLGTLVDEPAGIRAGIRDLDPSLDDARVEQLLLVWQQHIEREQQRCLGGGRSYLPATSSTRKRPGSSPPRPGSTTRPPWRRWPGRVAGSRRGPTPCPASPGSPSGTR